MTFVLLNLPDGRSVNGVDGEDIRELLQRHPTLSSHGIGGDPGQLDLTAPESLAQINRCIAFLSAFSTTRTPNVGSYGLKHLVEKAGTGAGRYVSNGALIAAVLFLGLPHRVDGPNIILSLPAAERRWVRDDGRKTYKGGKDAAAAVLG